MRITTWNVNSVKQRMPRIVEFLQQRQPDALCLQETKTDDATFPHMDVQFEGYQAFEHGRGGREGVAILVRNDLVIGDEITRGLPGEPTPTEARWIEVTVSGVRLVSVYVPNGRALEHPVFADKMTFLEAMRARITTLVAGGPVVVTGDINIAPSDLDVWDPARIHGGTHVSPGERAALQCILDAGVVDVFRHRDPDTVEYTWWDYRSGDFHANRGMRIDLIMATPALAAVATACGMDRDFRKGSKPSDHAPLSADFAFDPAVS